MELISGSLVVVVAFPGLQGETGIQIRNKVFRNQINPSKAFTHFLFETQTEPVPFRFDNHTWHQATIRHERRNERTASFVPERKNERRSMASKEQDDLVLDEATQQGQQIEYSNNYDYAGEAAAAEGESSTNENKWNKNGFGQGKLLLSFVGMLAVSSFEGNHENRNRNLFDSYYISLNRLDHLGLL